MKYLPFVVVLVVLGIGTLIEGKFSDRWGQAKSNRLSDFTNDSSWSRRKSVTGRASTRR